MTDKGWSGLRQRWAWVVPPPPPLPLDLTASAGRPAPQPAARGTACRRAGGSGRGEAGGGSGCGLLGPGGRLSPRRGRMGHGSCGMPRPSCWPPGRGAWGLAAAGPLSRCCCAALEGGYGFPVMRVLLAAMRVIAPCTVVRMPGVVCAAYYGMLLGVQEWWCGSSSWRCCRAVASAEGPRMIEAGLCVWLVCLRKARRRSLQEAERAPNGQQLSALPAFLVLGSRQQCAAVAPAGERPSSGLTPPGMQQLTPRQRELHRTQACGLCRDQLLALGEC